MSATERETQAAAPASSCRMLLSASEREALAAALAEARIDRPVDEVAALVRGVAASAARGRDWLRLIHPTPEGALAERLEALRDAAVASFDALETPAPAARLAALRTLLERLELDGFMLPIGADRWMDQAPPQARRLSWLTGFTGSAGAAVVLADRAALFVDGRYVLQAAAQVDATLYELCHIAETTVADWLGRHLRAGARLGYDPWQHGEASRARLAESCRAADASLTPCDENPIDRLWGDPPPPPLGPIRPHALRFAGASAAEKQQAVAGTLRERGWDHALVSAPDSIAWLLNVRGADAVHSPLPDSCAILGSDGAVDWFVDPRKLLPEVAPHLGNGVRVHAPEALPDALDRLATERRTVLSDRSTTPVWIVDRLTDGGASVVHGADPCAAPKARKNHVELEGFRAAHRRDGAALVRFLAWLAQVAETGRITECEAAAWLAEAREGGTHYCGPSFGSISAAGPNGAVIHYQATPETDRVLEPGTLYLIDSGGQYLDGTTDVTRTVAVGAPTAEHRDRFTRVLQGHIALATARFPRGATGSQLDTLARQFLWQAGLDYDHGTGHGVGSHLNVHEGPQRISKRHGDTALEPGMVVSNEPGYYKPGAYGIRIENLVAVVEVEGPAGGDRPLLGFETLTLAPIDRTLVDTAMLSAVERVWLDGYHAAVCETLAPLLEDDVRAGAWLRAATAPLA